MTFASSSKPVSNVPLRAYLALVSGFLFLFSGQAAGAQEAFGSAMSAPKALAFSKELHAGVLCLDYSSLAWSTESVRSLRQGTYPDNSGFFGASAAALEATAKEYEQFERELKEAGALAAPPGKAQMLLLGLSAPELLKHKGSFTEDYRKRIQSLSGSVGLQELLEA